MLISCVLSFFIAVFGMSALFADCLPAHYIWNLGLAYTCDVTPFRNGLPSQYSTSAYAFTDPTSYIKNVRRGDIIWVQSAQLNTFYYQVLPKIQEPFVLLINDGDESFPLQRMPDFPVFGLINHPKVIHIFTQNYDLPFLHKKVSPVPIGIDFHTIAAKNSWAFGEPPQSVNEQEVTLETILSSLKPTSQRKKRAYVDFHLVDSSASLPENRTFIFNQLYPTGLLDAASHRVARHLLWQKKGDYAFSISPRGNGLDCHRTWEDLVLGCIVIVKEWSEITEKNLDRWLEQYGDAFTNPSYRERLTHAYWMNKIRTKAIGLQ